MLDRPTRLELKLGDWVEAAPVIWAVVLLLVAPFFTPTFGEMFAEFGEPIPWLTALVLAPWFPLVLSVLPLGCLWTAFRAQSVGRRRAALVAGLVLGGVAISVCVVEIYLPVFVFTGSAEP